ncbi:MAG: tRNA (N6-isopentenyl adenosine(37)-C2)-methylthiotransferase MiaB [Anaerolineales bacterium]
MLYHIWTEGCQMNVADSQRVSSALEKLGYRPAPRIERADVIVLNTCVVRQSAEDKAYGRLTSLRPLKEERPGLVINLMGCLVGVKGHDRLREQFPYVDVFSPPSDPAPLIRHLAGRLGHDLEQADTRFRFALMDGDLVLPAQDRGRTVSGYVPVVYGCSHACTFCIIPFRRGPERSRPVGEIVGEVRRLAEQGVHEVTLLGQIVDRYGRDIPDGPHLSQLLRQVHDVPAIRRIRFLTSHPNWMTEDLLDTVAELPRVCEHIEVPVQAGDDEVLRRMKRGYTVDDYRRLIERIRRRIPDSSIATDVIVGFPGETEVQFERTHDLLAELRLDVVHLARYSARPGTVAARRMPDDVAEDEKMRRFRRLEDLQTKVSEEINAGYVGRTVEVLVEGRAQGRWKGRTRTHKLVFFEAGGEWRGRLAPVRIEFAGAWSLRGSLARPDPQPPEPALAWPSAAV